MSQSFYADPLLYDAMFAPRARIEFYAQQAQRSDGRVLELACGSGAVLAPIAAAGSRVVGVDLSEPMLEAARDRLDGAKAKLVRGDMRTFELGQKFGLIICAFNSLCHLHTAEDVLACFRRVRAHLARGGAFIFDVFNPDLKVLLRPAGVRFPEAAIEHPEHGELTVESEGEYDAAAQVRRELWHFSTRDQSRQWTAPLEMRSFFPQELPLLIAAAGLRLEDRFGDFTSSPFTSASPHQICICRAG